VIARNDHDLPRATESPADCSQHGLRDFKRLLRATLEQFDYVAQQHQSLHAVERIEEPLERLGPREDVVPQPAAEVEI
jgi:hypothetical protein